MQPQYPWNGSVNSPERWVDATEEVVEWDVAVYKASVGRIVMLILTTIMLLIMGGVNIAMSWVTAAPRIFGYASSLTRGDGCMCMPEGGTGMGDARRSKLLGNVGVQIGDIWPGKEMGFVALKSVGEDEESRTGRLKKGRLYW
jgi:hypothetical protein